MPAIWISSVSIPSRWSSSRTVLSKMAVFPFFLALPLRAITFMIFLPPDCFYKYPNMDHFMVHPGVFVKGGAPQLNSRP